MVGRCNSPIEKLEFLLPDSSWTSGEKQCVRPTLMSIEELKVQVIKDHCTH